jgi:hypothetical protein
MRWWYSDGGQWCHIIFKKSILAFWLECYQLFLLSARECVRSMKSFDIYLSAKLSLGTQQRKSRAGVAQEALYRLGGPWQHAHLKQKKWESEWFFSTLTSKNVFGPSFVMSAPASRTCAFAGGSKKGVINHSHLTTYCLNSFHSLLSSSFLFFRGESHNTDALQMLSDACEWFRVLWKQGEIGKRGPKSEKRRGWGAIETK